MVTNTLLAPPFQWQPTLRISRSRTRSFTFLQATRASVTSHSSTINTKALQTPSFKARSSAASHAMSASGLFDEDNQKKFYILGGERGIAKTHSAASLAVKFADHGHPTVLISFNPIRSLNDIFDQDLTDGLRVEGFETPLFGWKVILEEPKVDIKDYMDGLGLGNLMEQCAESKINIRLGSASLNEAIHIWKFMLSLESKFSNLDLRVVFDTSLMDDDQGLHTFCNPDDSDATRVIYDKTTMDNSRLSRDSLKKVGELIHGSTEYVITTIPTVKAVKESAREYDILKKEKVHVQRLIVNPVLSQVKTEDELLARWMIKNDPELSGLEVIEAPFVDLEMRGIPALKLMGNMMWK